MDKQGLVFICAHCGNISYSGEDSIDSGTTLVCDECGKKTIVALYTDEGYTERFKRPFKSSRS